MLSESVVGFFETRDIAVYALNGDVVCAALPDDLSDDVQVYLRENSEAIRAFVGNQPFQFYHSHLFNGGSPCLARFRTGSVGNLFCIHPLTGSSWCFRQIVDGFPLDYSIYGVYAPGFGSTWNTLPFREMVDIYAEQIILKQPTGPYWICGYSTGGTLALDVARRLKQAGHDVRPVCIVDTRLLDGLAAKNPSNQRTQFITLPPDDNDQPVHVWRYFAGVYFGWEIARKAVADPVFLESNLDDRLEYLLAQARRRNTLNQWWREQDIRAIFRFQTDLLRQCGKYKSELFDGSVAYFFADKEIDQRYAIEFLNFVQGEYKLVQCPGDHISMIFDIANALELGRRIALYIEDHEIRLSDETP